MANTNEDPANNDVFTQGGEHGFIGKPVIAYNIIFDEEAELKTFYAFIRALKKRYPQTRIIGSRINQYLKDEFFKEQAQDPIPATPKKRGRKPKVVEATEPAEEPSQP